MAGARGGEQMREVLGWRDVHVVVGLFCAAQLLDGLTTYVALSSHRFQEGNPLLSGILDSHPLAAFGVKLALAGVVVTVLLTLRLRWRLRLAVIALFAAASLVAPVENLLRLTGAPDPRPGDRLSRDPSAPLSQAPAGPARLPPGPATRRPGRAPTGPARRRASASAAATGSTAVPPPSIAASWAAEAARPPPTLVSTTSSAICRDEGEHLVQLLVGHGAEEGDDAAASGQPGDLRTEGGQGGGVVGAVEEQRGGAVHPLQPSRPAHRGGPGDDRAARDAERAAAVAATARFSIWTRRQRRRASNGACR